MKKLVIIAALLLCAASARAQVSYDTVTATITDPNGHPYANASWSATLVNSVGNQVYSATTPNGQIYNAAAAPPQGTVTAAGLLSMQLVPNNILVNPPGTQWLISVTFPSDREILTYNPPWTLNYTTTVTAPVDLSAQLSAIANSIEFINLRTGQNTLQSNSAVQQIIAGANCTVTPSTGIGNVTISCAGPVTQITAGSGISISPTTGVGNVTISATGGGGGGGCPLGTCVQNNGTATQTVAQSAGTFLNVNNFEGKYWADQYGATNGIETAYAQCLAQNGLGFSGCTLLVSPNYANTDVPYGWQFNSNVFSNPPMQIPSGGAIVDERNGTEYWQFHNPLNSITGQGTGVALSTLFDIDIAHSNAVLAGPNRSGFFNHVAITNGGDEFNYAIDGIPTYLTETYTYGDYTLMDDYIGGIDFGHYDIFNKRSNGDFVGTWRKITADAGMLSGNSEGTENADYTVQEDPLVFTGTVTGTPSTGATQVHVAATIGSTTQGGMYRWLVNQSSPLATGGALSGTISELTTGPAGNSAVMPPAIIDSTQNFPVSTMIQVCYSGTDNGVGGAAGCTSGSQPTGFIPSQNFKFTITGGSVTGGVATFTITPTSPQTTPVTLVAGQTVMLYGFALGGPGAFLNQQTVTVSATGLSTSGFQANVTGPNTASVGAGYSTYSPNGYSPAKAIPVAAVPTYTTGGGTGGLPAGFCTPSTLQTSNPGAACYIPTSGVGCIADQIEVEPVAYTYSGGTFTLNNLQFPHLNGAVFAVGGLACKTIEDTSSQYTGGGTSGVIDEVYPTVGSLNSTSVYYVPQRTNLGYASPPLGGSTDGSSFNGGINNSQQSALCFSASMSNIQLSGGTVTFSMANPAGTNGGEFPYYNNLTVSLAVTGNPSFSGNYTITTTGGSNFAYTPTSPTGSASTGTVSFCNAGYKILDAARVIAVTNPLNGAVDGTFVLFPNVASFSGATVREPHFQQIYIQGTHETLTQYQPKVWNGGNSDTITYQGNISGPGWGNSITNAGSSNVYLGGGGTLQPPSVAYGIFGPWLNDQQFTAPQQSIFSVVGWNLAGPSSPLSTFGLIQFPSLPGAFPGYAIDTLCYNPYYNFANRGSALTSGEYIFGNTIGAGCGSGVANGKVVSTVRMGHVLADMDGSIPEITSNDVTVAPLSNSPGNAPTVVNTPGSTCYNYEIVAHDKNGGSTVPQGPIGGSPCSINNGNATLNGTNFNRICAFFNPGVYSYDFLKQVAGVYQSMATNVAVGNGATYGQVPNYTCVNDQGGTTSTYNMPTQNTTGSVAANSIVAATAVASVSMLAPNLYATNLTVGNCVQAGAGGLLVTTSTPCGTGGGGGMVYPPTGVGNSTGSAWGTSYQVGAAPNDLLQLDGSGNLPALNASALTGYLYSNLSGSGIIPIANGGTGTSSPGLIAGSGITLSGSWPNQTISASGGGSGFPFTLGTTSITSGSTTTSINGLTVNGVNLNSGGSASLYLAQNGSYSSPAVVSSFAAPSASWPSWLVPSVATPTSTPSLTVAASTIPVSAGGTGTTSPSIVAGAGISVSGTWPNQTVTATVTQVADVSISIPAFSVPANTCYGSSGSTTPQTVTMTGVTISPVMAILPSFAGNPSAIVGWGTTGGLSLKAWASAANQASYVVCNPTATTISGGAITLILAAQ